MAATETNDWYLEGIKDRSPDVIKAIFSNFFPMVRDYILKNSGNKEAAQDVFMDAIEGIYRKVQQDKLVLTSKFSTYLYEVCRRLWLNVLRKDKKIAKGVTIDDSQVSNKAQELAEPLEKTERYRLMREKFELLPGDCKQLLTLSWHSDHSLQKIAEMMTWTYGYARKRKYLCKTKLIDLVRQDSRYKELKSPAA